MAVDKSPDVIVNTVFHGLNNVRTIPAFSGRYHGPVSTTTELSIASDFANTNGMILELYPSYGRKGLQVSWLSNHPQEKEVLYFDASFDIKKIHYPEKDTIEKVLNDETQLLLSTKEAYDIKDNVWFVEKAILKALQTINTSSTVLSFNDMGDHPRGDHDTKEEEPSVHHDTCDSTSLHVTYTPLLSQPPLVPMSIGVTSLDDFDTDHESTPETNGYEGIVDNMKVDHDVKEEQPTSKVESFNDQRVKVETFDKLSGQELVAILQLLYLQYKPTDWKDLVQSREDVYTQIALAKYRDQFAQLTQNVTTIRMDRAPELIKRFFSTSIDLDNENGDAFAPNLPTEFEHIECKIRFLSVVKLFPKCKTLSIDGDNFDWSLNDFIAFLKGYNLDFSDVQLQDIYILFRPHYLEKDAERM
eukprot:1015065_1